MRTLTLLALASLAACGGDSFVGGDAPVGVDDSGVTPGLENNNITPGRPSCPGQEVTVTGTVLAPNQTDPVPGATVFIPSQVPELFPPAVTCEVCATMAGTSSWWTTTSAYNGQFTLKAVCPGKRPLVLQNGRFRRLVYIDVPAGGSLQVPADKTRLPKRSQEFELADAVPKIAVGTGDFDKMECVLRRIGLDDKSIELYENADNKSPTALPTFQSLVNDVNKMKTYNIIFLNCTNNTFEAELKKAAVRANIADYIQSGGRFYVTDWSYDWIEQVPELSPFIDFEPGPWGTAPEAANAAALGANGLQVQAALKVPELAQWLGQFPGTVQNNTALIQHFVGGWVMMHAVSKDTKLWVEGPVKSDDGKVSGVRPLTVTFNFKNCGKILYTSYHTEGREGELFPTAFPQYCGSSAISPQDRILEYLIFDIANCVKPIE